MLSESASRLAAALEAWLPDDVAVIDHAPDTRAPPFVYVTDSAVNWRQGLVVTHDAHVVVEGGLSPAARADELRHLVDLVLAACAQVATLADCRASFGGTRLMGDVANPEAVVSVPIFHAACELPQQIPAMSAAG